jgi:putative membrane protein
MSDHVDHPAGGVGMVGLLGVWLSLAVPLVAAVGYVAAVGRVLRRGGIWPWWRTALWCAGLLTAAIAIHGPAALGRHDFTAHMVGHLLLGMAGPLLLVSAAPVTLALRALPVRRARQLARLLRARPVRVRTHPVTAVLLNAGGLWLLYTNGLYQQMNTRPWLQLAVHAHIAGAGYLFTAAIIGVDPAPHRPTARVRAAVVVAFLATHDILAKHLYAHPPAGVPAGQAGTGGQFMYYGGDLLDLILITVFCWQWYTTTTPRTYPSPVPPPPGGTAPTAVPSAVMGTGGRPASARTASDRMIVSLESPHPIHLVRPAMVGPGSGLDRTARSVT